MHAIPKIQYQVLSLAGNTNLADDVITGLLDTSEVAVGMVAVGAGIPAGATVLSKTLSTVTLSDLASATATAVPLEFFRELVFDFPPVEDTGETIEPNEKTSTSLNGTRQVLLNFFERFRQMQFRHIPQSLKAKVESFMANWASRGEPFRYFDDKTLTDFVVYELKNLDFKPKKITAKGYEYVWEFPMSFRRIFDSPLDEVSPMQSFTVIKPTSYPHQVVKNTIILVDTSAIRTLQLPEPASGLTFRLKDAKGLANTNNITVARFGTEKIDTVAANRILSTNYGAWEFTADGADWYITII